MIVGKATNVGEYSVSRIDIRADDLLISAPIRVSCVKRAWVIDPAALTVSPGWA